MYPATSSKTDGSKYSNGNYLQKSLTEDSCDQESPSDEDSSPDASPKEKEKVEEVTPGLHIIVFIF